MSTRFACSPSGVSPAEFLAPAVQQLSWTQDSDEVQLSFSREVSGIVTGVNGCEIAGSRILVTELLQDLTELQSVDITLHTGDEKGTEQRTPNKDSGISMLFLEIPDGPIGIDLQAVQRTEIPGGPCGGLLVASVVSNQNFRVNDVITACNGASLTNLSMSSAINVLAHPDTRSRKLVVRRRTKDELSLPLPTEPERLVSPIKKSGYPKQLSTLRTDANLDITDDMCTVLPHFHHCWRPLNPRMPFTANYALRQKASSYTRYVCSSKKRAANRISFDYIPGLD